jgi:hypothetical protein
MHAVTIGLDIAKSLFQVHGVDFRGSVVIRRQLKRRQGSRARRCSRVPRGLGSSAAAGEGAASGVRPHDHSVAPVKRGQPSA